MLLVWRRVRVLRTAGHGAGGTRFPMNGWTARLGPAALWALQAFTTTRPSTATPPGCLPTCRPIIAVRALKRPRMPSISSCSRSSCGEVNQGMARVSHSEVARGREGGPAPQLRGPAGNQRCKTTRLGSSCRRNGCACSAGGSVHACNKPQQQKPACLLTCGLPSGNWRTMSSNKVMPLPTRGLQRYERIRPPY